MPETSGEGPSDQPLGDKACDDRVAERPAPQHASDISPAELKAIHDAFTGQDPDAQRFSLWGLLGVITAASLLLAVGSYVPKPIFAGGVGIATLLTMVILSAMKNPPAVLQVAWWTLLLIYLMAIGSAILG